MAAKPERAPIDELLELDPESRERVIAALTQDEAFALLHSWRVWAREAQLYDPEPEEEGRLVRAGRGWGKTLMGAQATIEIAKEPDRCGGRITLVGRTAADVRSFMLYGESGIMTISPPDFRPIHNPSKRLLTWPNGVVAETYSADKPEQLRGPNSGFAWLDELAHWNRAQESFDQVVFGNRLGMTPRWLATTTPLPTKLIRNLVKDEHVVVISGSTYDNIRNLAPLFIRNVVRRYEGTRLGRQELEGQILDDNPNAFWAWDMFRPMPLTRVPDLVRIVIAVDPAVTSKPTSDETGIIVAGIDRNRLVYVLEDASGHYSPHQWATRVLKLWRTYQADRIVGEVNNGGDLVEDNIRRTKIRVDGQVLDGRSVAFSQVRAYRGKAKRAEPVAGQYEQGRVFHVTKPNPIPGEPRNLAELEEQLTSFDPTQALDDQDDDRLDANVYAITELTGGDDPRSRLKKLGNKKALERLRQGRGRRWAT